MGVERVGEEVEWEYFCRGAGKTAREEGEVVGVHVRRRRVGFAKEVEF